MPKFTYYVVQPFIRAKKGNRVIPGIAQEVANHGACLARLRSIQEGKIKDVVGALAFAKAGDITTGEFSDPTMIGMAGIVPEEALTPPEF